MAAAAEKSHQEQKYLTFSFIHFEQIWHLHYYALCKFDICITRCANLTFALRVVKIWYLHYYALCKFDNYITLWANLKFFTLCANLHMCITLWANLTFALFHLVQIWQLHTMSRFENFIKLCVKLTFFYC